MSTPRVRFAPSPTGPLHIGGIRTALYNYLFAKKNNGSFILRLEDTDQNRLVEGAESYILEALKWSGIIPDEGFGIGGGYGPYRQSERKNIYFSFLSELLKKGLAYYAFDKAERLEELKKEAQSRGETFIYGPLNREHFDHSLKLKEEELNLRLQKKEPYVIRFKTPIKKNFRIFDQLRGEIFINTELLDDKVLLKSDGMPTYHLASVVDDYLMEISHVIRGEEWLPSLAFHLLLYEAFGWKAPQFIHLPLILNAKGGGKLSKREATKSGALIFPLQWKDPKTNFLTKGYKEAGYFPESFINILALLGWNPGGEKEIFSMNELISEFSLEKLSKSGARFNPSKALWVNGKHLQRISLEKITRLFCNEFYSQTSNFKKSKLIKIVNETRPRANFISEIWQQSHYFFEPPKSYEEKALKKIRSFSIEILKDTKKFLEKIENFEQQNLKKEIEKFIQLQDLKFIEIAQVLRLSFVGALKGVDLFFILELIGKDESLNRIEKLISYLKNN